MGGGFLESVYEKALTIELKTNGLKAENQKPLTVKYKKVKIGDFVTDIIVDGKIIIEIKAVSEIKNQHKAQLINYLKATGLKIGLLVNFGEKIKFIRVVY